MIRIGEWTHSFIDSFIALPSFSYHIQSLSSPLIQGMGYLLPILAELLRDHDEDDVMDPDPGNTKQ